MKILGLILLSSLLFISTVKSSEDLNEYYTNVFMGEKKTHNYFGPLNPGSTVSESNGQLSFLDDIFKERYLNSQIQGNSFELYQYWFDEVVEKSACPDTTLAENMDYIRYLYRLVTISYLFEGIKINNKISRQFGDNNICVTKFKDIFESCEPVSPDMKKFHERVYGKFVNEIEKVQSIPFSKKEKASWMEEFHNSNSLSTNPAFSRLHDWCIAHKKNCRNLNIEEVKAALSEFCSNDTKTIGYLCSERDSFYGLSSITTPTELIKNSNAFNLINQSGMGEECLRRYGKLFQTKEVPSQSLLKQYPLLYSYLLKNNERYLQGELFLPGALKEFDKKGLSDFLSALKPPKKEVLAAVKAPKKPKAVVVAIPEPVVIVPKVETPVVVEVAPLKIEPQLSAFEQAVAEFNEKGAAVVAVNMDIFRDDFEFTQGMVAELSGPIKKFQTRAALTDMKSYDLLGSVGTPVGLIFLKFLIDTENHQGLYNIVTVLGNKFYVSNDIEKKTIPHYIELKNDASTQNRWQIILVKK